jgi:hypothetical protein
MGICVWKERNVQRVRVHIIMYEMLINQSVYVCARRGDWKHANKSIGPNEHASSFIIENVDVRTGEMCRNAYTR